MKLIRENPYEFIEKEKKKREGKDHSSKRVKAEEKN